MCHVYFRFVGSSTSSLGSSSLRASVCELLYAAISAVEIVQSIQRASRRRVIMSLSDEHLSCGIARPSLTAELLRHSLPRTTHTHTQRTIVVQPDRRRCDPCHPRQRYALLSDCPSVCLYVWYLSKQVIQVIHLRKYICRAPLTLLAPIPLTLYTLPYWSNTPFLIFDIRALWRSVLSARAPECQKLKMMR